MYPQIGQVRLYNWRRGPQNPTTMVHARLRHITRAASAFLPLLGTALLIAPANIGFHLFRHGLKQRIEQSAAPSPSELKGKSHIPNTVRNIYVKETGFLWFSFRADMQEDMIAAAKKKKGGPCFAVVFDPNQADAILTIDESVPHGEIWVADARNGSILWGRLIRLPRSDETEEDLYITNRRLPYYLPSVLYRAAGCSASGVRKKS